MSFSQTPVDQTEAGAVLWLKQNDNKPSFSFLRHFLTSLSKLIHLQNIQQNMLTVENKHVFFFFKHNFCVKPYVPREPEGTQVIVGSMNMDIYPTLESNSQPVLFGH